MNFRYTAQKRLRTGGSEAKDLVFQGQAEDLNCKNLLKYLADLGFKFQYECGNCHGQILSVLNFLGCVGPRARTATIKRFKIYAWVLYG